MDGGVVANDSTIAREEEERVLLATREGERELLLLLAVGGGEGLLWFAYGGEKMMVCEVFVLFSVISLVSPSFLFGFCFSFYLFPFLFSRPFLLYVFCLAPFYTFSIKL